MPGLFSPEPSTVLEGWRPLEAVLKEVAVDVVVEPQAVEAAPEDLAVG